MKTARKVLFISLFLLSIALPMPLLAQVNISGKPGLMYIPSADVLEDGTFSIGYNYNPVDYAFRFNKKNSESICFVNLVLLPKLEVNINLLMPNGPVRFQDRGIGDRQIDLKYALLTEKAKRPSVALILSAPFGIDNSLVTYALAATKHVPVTKTITAGITVGMGSPYSIYRAEVRNDQNADIFSGYTLKDKRDKPYHYLSGPFGGVNLSFARKGGVMVEWDSQHLNVGAYTTLFTHWTLQAGLLNGDQLTFGTSYSWPLLKLPKRVKKHGA
ncbi:YjbH domain-containing protein [Spirosoma soli]|uniref:YjbH domain-containing protein n=1 Tax=Spirosoma soli TaxID=1770529 RepID=A0ABW5M3A3_9BACT